MTECVLDVLNVTCAVASGFGTHFHFLVEPSNDLEIYSLYITGVVIFLFSVASLLLSRFARWKNKNMNRSENHIDWTKYQLLPIYENLQGLKNLSILISVITSQLKVSDDILLCSEDPNFKLMAFDNKVTGWATLFSGPVCFKQVNGL